MKIQNASDPKAGTTERLFCLSKDAIFCNQSHFLIVAQITGATRAITGSHGFCLIMPFGMKAVY
jgi:hypothetical protein